MGLSAHLTQSTILTYTEGLSRIARRELSLCHGQGCCLFFVVGEIGGVNKANDEKRNGGYVQYRVLGSM